MAMVSYIRDQLIKVFSPHQADVLAHVVVEAHDALATKSDVHELRDVVKDLAVAQRTIATQVSELVVAQQTIATQVSDLAVAQQATERSVAELAEAQRATERQMAESAAHVDQRFAEMAEAGRDAKRQMAESAARVDQLFAEVAESRRENERRMAESAAHVDQRFAEMAEAGREAKRQMAESAAHVDQRFAEMAEAGREAKRQMAESAAHVDQRFAEMAEAQRATEKQVAELTASMRESFIRHDRADGWLYEMLLAKRLPAYIGREIRRCRVIEVQDLIESLEPLLDDGVLTVADLDDLRRVDLVATGFTDGEAVYLVGEVSCTGDNEDAERAARRAAIVEKAGKRAIAFLACHQIGPAAAEFARRRGVRILERGNLLPAAG